MLICISLIAVGRVGYKTNEAGSKEVICANEEEVPDAIPIAHPYFYIIASRDY